MKLKSSVNAKIIIFEVFKKEGRLYKNKRFSEG